MATANFKAEFNCPVEKLWAVVTDLADYAWRSDLSRIEVIDDSRFVEYTKEGFATEFTVTACEPCRLWEFTMENANMRGRWSGKFSAQGEKTVVDFTEEVFAKKLLMKPFVGAYLRRQQKQYVADLQRECEGR